MRELGGQATISELAAAMNVGYNTAWSLVREMSARGDLEELVNVYASETGGRPSPTYRLQ